MQSSLVRGFVFVCGSGLPDKQIKPSSLFQKLCLTFHLRYCFCFAPLSSCCHTINNIQKSSLLVLPSFTHAHNPTKHHHHATTTRTPSQVKERHEKKSRTKEDYLQTHSSGSFFPVTKNATYAVPRGTLSRTHATPTLIRTGGTHGGRARNARQKRTKLFFFSRSRNAHVCCWQVVAKF